MCELGALPSAPLRVSSPAVAEAGAGGRAPGREDGVLRHGLEADKAQGAPRLPQGHHQAEEAAPPSGKVQRPPGESWDPAAPASSRLQVRYPGPVASQPCPVAELILPGARTPRGGR